MEPTSHASMDGRLGQQTHGTVADGNITIGPKTTPEEAYTTSGMQVAHIPECSSCEESLAQANHSSLANLHCQNTVPDSQPL